MEIAKAAQYHGVRTGHCQGVPHIIFGQKGRCSGAGVGRVKLVNTAAIDRIQVNITRKSNKKQFKAYQYLIAVNSFDNSNYLFIKKQLCF